MLDARRLLTFRAVARAGSFSRAAEALALSQPAVSQQVAALERELGVSLLVRGAAAPCRPTRAGSCSRTPTRSRSGWTSPACRWRRSWTRRAARCASARSRARSPRSSRRPSPRCAPSEPELEIAVEEGSLAGIAEGVRSGRLDVAMAFQDAADPPRDHGGLRREELAEERMVAVLGAGHRLAGRERIELTELRDDPWMAPSRDGLVVQACRAAGFEPHARARDPRPARGPRDRRGGHRGDDHARAARPPAPARAWRTPRSARPRPRRSLYALLPPAGAHEKALAMVDALRAACGQASDAPAAA